MPVLAVNAAKVGCLPVFSSRSMYSTQLENVSLRSCAETSATVQAFGAALPAAAPGFWPLAPQADSAPPVTASAPPAARPRSTPRRVGMASSRARASGERGLREDARI